MNSNYFLWDGSPVIFTIGEFTLPFSVSIPGLILAIIAFFVLPGFLFRSNADDSRDASKKRRKKRNARKSGDDTEEHAVALTGWQAAGFFIGCLAAGQLLFLALPGPELQQIGPIQPRWYGFLFAGAFISGYFIGRKLFRDAGKDVELADTLLSYIVVATVIGARLGHVIFYDFDYYIRNLPEVLYIWQGGLASHGAAIGIILALWLYMQKYPGLTFLWLTDRLVIPVSLGGAFVRLGNFFNSEIYGLPTEVPWAVIFARIDMLPRHPTMLYESLICIIVLVILIGIYRYYRKQPPEGLLTAAFMIILFTSRFFVEYTKVEQAPFTETWMFGMGQLLSIPFVIFGIWILLSKINWSKNGIGRT